MITLIHGPAELLRSEAVAAIRPRISGDPGLADLNTVVLDGRQTSLVDLHFACDALPFLADRRLVVVEGLLRRAQPARGRSKAAASGSTSRAPKGASAEAGSSSETDSTEDSPAEPPQQQALLAYLDTIPETTELVFVEDEVLSTGPVLRKMTDLQRAGQANIVVCAALRRGDLPAWIRACAQTRDVELDAAAVADLVEFVGDDLRQLDQELIKLSDYGAGSAGAGSYGAGSAGAGNYGAGNDGAGSDGAGSAAAGSAGATSTGGARRQGQGGRTITRADVRRLVPETRAANVFDLVEALGSGNLAGAGRLLVHALDTDGEQPLRLMALISRQYRLIMMAKELQAQGANQSEIARQVGVPDWTVPKLLISGRPAQLPAVARSPGAAACSRRSDQTGKLSDREAMDVLLAELANL